MIRTSSVLDLDMLGWGLLWRFPCLIVGTWEYGGITSVAGICVFFTNAMLVILSCRVCHLGLGWV